MPSGKMSDKELVMENEAKDFKDLDEEYLELLIKLADFYNVSIDYLLCQTNDPKRN